MTEYITEAQAIDINAIIEKALAAAKSDITSKIEDITKVAVPENPFKKGDKVLVAADAKAVFNKRGVADGEVFFKNVETEAEVIAIYTGEFTDEYGNVRVKAAGTGKEQWVSPQFLTAAPKFKDGDRVKAKSSATGTEIVGELLSKGQPCEYASERMVKKDTGEKVYVTASTIVPAPRVLKVGNVVEIPASVNSAWAGQGVIKRLSLGSVGVEMLTGSLKGEQGAFFPNKLVFVADEQPKPKAEWAVGDRVLVNGKAGDITTLMPNCCGNDEVRVSFDGAYDYGYFGYADIESLDDRKFDVLNRYERPAVGEKLTLAVKYGTTKVAGQKVTVVDVDRSADYEGLLITVRPDSGWDYRAFSHRFARTV